MEKLIQDFRMYAEGIDEITLLREWNRVITPQAIQDWQEYRKASRVGMEKGLSIKEPGDYASVQRFGV